MIEQKLNEFITEILLHELIYNPLKNMKYDELLFKNSRTTISKWHNGFGVGW